VNKDLSDLRQEYTTGSLLEENISSDPVAQFDLWFQEVLMMNIDMANAMVLATADLNGRPSARYVLLKEFSHKGFVFYTNSLSQKGRELKVRPEVALVFYWKELHRQVRIEGVAEKLPVEDTERYFGSRPRGSQISAWVAIQSEVIPDWKYLHEKAGQLAGQFQGKPVPRPESWSGYRIIPSRFEFWQGQGDRLHDRLVYEPDNSGGWIISRLAP
jgi:pyridoxamine 5'-phosphate oxidase